jgi:arabinofuranan 3-O-arabinosyltransferase
VSTTALQRRAIGDLDVLVERRPARSWQPTDRQKYWGLAGGLAVLSFGSTLLNSPGSYIADSRFEHYWASTQYLVRHQWLWDSFRGLGKATPYFAPAVAGVLAAMAAVGMSAATAEHSLHALYLITAGLGMVSVLRLYRPRLGLEHLLAALVYMFSPYTAQFLLPSGLFLHYAIAPWLLVAVARGLRDDGRMTWRWPAAFALTVFVVGSLNIPSLMYACVPIVPLVIFVVAVERSARWRDVGRFVLRAGLLVGIGSLATALQLRGTAPIVAENLSTTELPSTVSRNSSWAESWRGLGFWLSYFRTTTGSARPEAAPFFTNALVIVTSFAIPVIAIASLWWSRWRARLLFAGMAIVSLVLMVGLYPIARPAPIGRVIDEAYNGILFLRGLRSGYKAGAGFAMGVAGLFGVGVADVVRRLRHSVLEALPSASRAAVRTVPILAVAMIGISSFPFWNGSLYSPADRVDALPQYWRQAIAAVNALPDGGRVLILPGAERNRYRWGYLGDDMFDAMLTQPHLLRQSFSQGLPETGSLLAALDERTVNDHYQQGSFAPLARILGVKWVLIRNDLDWQTMGAARPSDLDGLRADPALERIATFGSPGQDTSAGDDATAGLLGETALPPVELYEVQNSPGIVQLRPNGPPLLVSGDGEGLVSLSATGALNNTPGFRFTASTSTDDLRNLLAAGSPVVITDTNRRRATQVTSSHNLTSYTLPAGADLDRPALDLYGVPGSQAVATYGVASDVTSSGFGSSLSRYENWLRPANAFDHDPSTAWRTAGAADPVGQWLRLDLSQSTVLSRLVLTPSPEGAKRRISAVTISFPDGSSTKATINDSGSTVVDFPARAASWFRVQIDQVLGSGVSAVGFSEIDVPGVDTTEALQVPDDLFRAASSDPVLAQELSTADVRYSFDRLLRLGAQDEEIAVNRRFETVGDRAFSFWGTLRVDDSTSDAVLDRLTGAPVGAIGSDRFGSVATARGGLAIDGRADTAWQAPPIKGEALTIHFPSQQIDSIDISVANQTGSGPGLSDITELEVTAGDGSPVSCSPAPMSDLEAIGCHVAVESTVTDHVVVTVAGVRSRPGPLGDQPVGISEVAVRNAGGANVLGSPASQLDTACREVATVDGAPLFARARGSVDALVAGTAIPLEQCGSLVLHAGWHDFASQPDYAGALGHAELRAAGKTKPPTTAGPVGTVTISHDTPAGADIRVDSPNGGTLVLGQSFAPGWNAAVAGHTSAAQSIDTMSAWKVPAGISTLSVHYAPQRLYELGLAAMAGTAALCVVLIVRRGRTPAMAAAEAHTTAPSLMDARAPRELGGRNEVLLAAVLAIAAFLFANLEGAVLAVGAVMAARRAGVKLIGKAAAGAIALAGLATLAVALSGTSDGIAGFVSRRSFASIFGQLAAVLVVVYVVVAAVDERALTPRVVVEERRSWQDRLLTGWRARLLPVAVASAAATVVAATLGTRSNGLLVAGASAAACVAVAALSGIESLRTRWLTASTRTASAPSHLVQGSVWLMAGFVVQAVTGVAFWIVAARVDSAVDVGRASALFASMQFVNYATAMGLQEMLARFTAIARDDADVLFSWAVVVTTATSAFGTVIYAVIASAQSDSKLSSVGSVGGIILFFLLSAGAAVALLVDARLMTARRWRWVFGRLAAVGAIRLPLLLIPSAVDRSIWLFVAIAAPIAASGVVGLAVLRRDDGLTLRLTPRPKSARAATHYALINYLSHLALSAPQFALPVIVLANVGPVANANFFVAWSIAAVAFILPVTIGRVLLTEGSRTEQLLEQHTDTAMRLGLGLMIAAAAATFLVQRLLPMLYGPQYSLAAEILPWLVLGGVPWAITAIAIGRARVSHDHVGTVLMTATLAVSILGMALVAVPTAGVEGAVRAWVAGTSLSAVVAILVSVRASTRAVDRPVQESIDA